MCAHGNIYVTPMKKYILAGHLEFCTGTELDISRYEIVSMKNYMPAQNSGVASENVFLEILSNINDHEYPTYLTIT